MTGTDFNKICDSVLNRIQPKKDYVKLCEVPFDFDNRKGLIKKEALEIKKELDLDFKLAGTERMFYKDYFFDEIQLRFFIPYGHGMIDCSYRVFKGMTDNNIPSFSYGRIVESVKGISKSREFTFPKYSNIEEFKKALIFIIELNEQIKIYFKEEISKHNQINNKR